MPKIKSKCEHLSSILGFQIFQKIKSKFVCISSQPRYFYPKYWFKTLERQAYSKNTITQLPIMPDLWLILSLEWQQIC